MNKISFKDLEIEHICKSSLKNSYISVTDEKITIKTPKVSSRYIEQLLTDKETWIRKQLFKLKQKVLIKINLEDEVLLFGEVLSIDVDEAKILREYLGKLKIENRENILKCYDRFYKHYAKLYLTPRLDYFSQLMGLRYSKLKFRKMKSRWGSCSSRGTITLNTELMKVKKELIDYVIVHELAHLKHMNHSKRFHSFVEEYLSDSYALRRELKNINIVYFL